MSMEIKQHLKLSQQLVMTPQLQQAIKLLQLSRMELVDVVREELLENPVLEDTVESAQTQQAEGRRAGRGSAQDDEPGRAHRRDRDADGPLRPASRPRRTPEVKADTRSTARRSRRSTGRATSRTRPPAPPMPSYSRNDDDLPSLEATLDPGHVAVRPPRVAAEARADFSAQEEAVALLIIGNLDADGYLDVSRSRRSPRRRASPSSSPRRCCKTVPGARSRRGRRAQPAGVPAHPGAAHRAPTTSVVIGIITKHLAQPREEELRRRSRKDLKEPLDEIYEAAKVVMGSTPSPGRNYTGDEPHYITPDVYVHKVGDEYFVVANDDGLPKLKISDVLPRRPCRAAPKAQGVHPGASCAARSG